MTVYFGKKTGIKLNIGIDRVRFVKVLHCVTLSLLLIALGLVIAISVLESQYTRVRIEAGERISAEDILGEGARFGEDFDPDCINRAGYYYFTVYTDVGAEKIRLSVKDTKAPEVVLRDVYFAVGGEMPTPIDFIESIYEPDSFVGEFLDELPDMKKPGEHTLRLRFTDASGNKTEILSGKMIEIYDNQPPEIDVSPLIVCEVGGAVAYKPYVTLSDNCIGKLSFSVDESGLDLSQPGDYDVFVTGRDGVGNMTKKQKVTVRVVEAYDEKVLSELLDELVEDIDPEGKSAEEICREVYKTVRDMLIYTGDSKKGDVGYAAYQAILGGGGDCYSYFALSKLLLERCGVETIDIVRAEGYTEDTHYWSLVNIGAEGKDLWYHFDATELMRDRYDHSGCLLTDRQINAYSKARPYFYVYDKRGLPEISDRIITPTPRLEELYE